MRTSNRKILAAVLCSATLLAGCDIFKSDDKPAPPTPVLPGTPQTQIVAPSTLITFTAITTTHVGATETANVSITGGGSPLYAVITGADCATGTFGSANSTVTGNKTFCVRHTSGAGEGTSVASALTVGSVSGAFTSTTTDTTPNPFTFTAQTNVAVNTVQTSNTVTIGGINSPAPISVTGGTYSINGGAFIATAGNVSNGNTVQVRHTSSSAGSTAVNTTLTVGGVSGTFTSTTAATTSTSTTTLLPFLTGTGDLKLLDPTVAISGTNPVTVDTGLAPASSICSTCFGSDFAQATSFFSATFSGTTASNIHIPRLAYIKRAPGNNSGGQVFKLNLVKGQVNTPVRISSITDACSFTDGGDLGDFQNIDNSTTVIERAGTDLMCSGGTAANDNQSTVIRLNSPTTDAGTTLLLARNIGGNSLVPQRNASLVITGYVSFELAFGTTPVLAHRDANFLNPQTLLTMADFNNANIRSTDFTHLFVTAKPSGQGLRLYRVESGGTLSGVLHTFASGAFFNPIDGAHDATNLYFTDGGSVLRIAQAATTESAVVMTTVASAVTINRVNLDKGTTPTRLAFEAQNSSTPSAGGVFSVPTNATGATATPLANTTTTVFAQLQNATQGRTYINLRNNSTGAIEALKINTDGTGTPTTTTNAHWAGGNFATSFDFAADANPPALFLYLATRSGSSDDALAVVDPATGVTGFTLGTIVNTQGGRGVMAFGLGRYALLAAHINRGGNQFDFDVYFLDAQTANSLAPLGTTSGFNDIPLAFD